MYHVSHQGQPFGPYSVEQLNQYLAQGALDASTYAWDQTSNQWVGIGQVPGVILPIQQAQPVPVAPVATTQATTVPTQKQPDPAPAQEIKKKIEEKKKPEGVKKKKPAGGKPNTLKIVLMFGIAGALGYMSYYFGTSALEEKKLPNADMVRVVIRLLIAILAFCWILVCVTYPFRKDKKGK